jgi:hypothetical protein
LRPITVWNVEIIKKIIDLSIQIDSMCPDYSILIKLDASIYIKTWKLEENNFRTFSTGN